MSRRAALLLLAPAVLLIAALLGAPLLWLIRFSIHEGQTGVTPTGALTLAHYARALGDGFYLAVFGRTLGLALLITLVSAIVSYPLAHFMWQAPPRWRGALTILALSPLLVSIVVSSYGWMVILGDRGIIAALLRWGGMERPPRMVFNTTGVVVGLTEILMPYMILALIAGFGRLNTSLEEAAASLGARPFTVFRRVVLPLTLPGIMLGCLLAFVLAVSSFITPKLLGGGRVFLLATEIYDQAIVTLNWPVAAALSIVVLVIFGIALTLYGRLARAVA